MGFEPWTSPLETSRVDSSAIRLLAEIFFFFFISNVKILIIIKKKVPNRVQWGHKLGTKSTTIKKNRIGSWQKFKKLI